jgi:hypothetical protein
MPTVKHPYKKPPKFAFMQWFDIASKVNPDKVYLRRLRVVQTPWFGVYLHWIYETDTDRYPHDHPWKFWSFILRGTYSEDVFYSLNGDPDRRTWKRWSIHDMPMNMAHRITSISDGLLTLVFVGRRRGTWYFWTPEGLVEWSVLEADEGELA